MTKVTTLVVTYQLDDLSPSYWIDHFQHPENTEISDMAIVMLTKDSVKEIQTTDMARYVEEYGKKNMQLCTTILMTTITMIMIMNLKNN